MPLCHFITHPEVVIDPCVPIPEWRLSAEGIRRMQVALEQKWMANIASLFCSNEQKAIDSARLIGKRFGLTPVCIATLGENDRSATGYLPKAEFEATADDFFAYSDQSVRGWERAIDAQHRIVAAVERLLAETPRHGDVAIVSHGGVGTLLICKLKGIPISRLEDQPGAGGGCVFTFHSDTRALLTDWRQMEG